MAFSIGSIQPRIRQFWIFRSCLSSAAGEPEITWIPPASSTRSTRSEEVVVNVFQIEYSCFLLSFSSLETTEYEQILLLRGSIPDGNSDRERIFEREPVGVWRTSMYLGTGPPKNSRGVGGKRAHVAIGACKTGMAMKRLPGI